MFPEITKKMPHEPPILSERTCNNEVDIKIQTDYYASVLL